MIANIQGNNIHIEKCDYTRLTIYLNDHLVDLGKKVTVYHNGKKIASVKPRRTIAAMYSTLNQRGDRSYAFPCIIEVEME